MRLSLKTLNMLIASTGGLCQLFYEVIALIGTCTHASLPRARIHNILSPDFAGSGFPGRDVFSDLERCEHLFWNLTGESVMSSFTVMSMFIICV